MAKNVKTKITTDKKLAASKGTKTSTPKKIEIANTKSKSSTTTKVKKDSLPNPKSKKSKKVL